MNLCVNARDAMPAGGEISIRMKNHVIDAATASPPAGARAGNYVCITIADTGTGMSAEVRRKVFEPFFTTKEPGKGTGLGLATVYSIVKQHHGWVTVKSAVGKGTAFHVFLPGGTKPTSTANDVHAPSAIEGGVEGILVVEDDAGFRNMVVLTLKVLGYRVFEAIDGPTALAVWGKHAAEIAVLFTDQVMPGGLSGLELCKRFYRAKPALHRIISTGYAADRVNPEQLSAEGIDFLPKPFSSEALAKAIRRCIEQPNGVSLTATGVRLPPPPS